MDCGHSEEVQLYPHLRLKLGSPKLLTYNLNCSNGVQVSFKRNLEILQHYEYEMRITGYTQKFHEYYKYKLINKAYTQYYHKEEHIH